MDKQLIPGWYGKIPAIGDFSSRRLPTEFIQFWDNWLQESIITSQEQLGENWLNIYLNCPIWRFILMPGLYDQHIWTGILMPSVDKVGRYFPLTIVIRLEVSPGVLTTIINAHYWFANIEQIALKSLNTDFSLEELDQYLIEHPFPTKQNDSEIFAIQRLSQWWNSDDAITKKNKEYGQRIEQLSVENMPIFFSSLMESHFIQSGTNKTLWWREDINTQSVQLKYFSGIPEAEQFITLLSSDDMTLACTGNLN